MNSAFLMAISFGTTLGLVVGLRLNAAGLLLVATLLFGAMLLCPLLAWRAVAEGGAAKPRVIIERPTRGDIGGAGGGLRALAAAANERSRRGGWPFLEGVWRGPEREIVDVAIRSR